MKLHVNRGPASARQLKGVLVDSDADNEHLLNYADEVLGHCEAWRAFDKAPHVISRDNSAGATILPASRFRKVAYSGKRLSCNRA